MNVFVSYSRRDGIVTTPMLNRLYTHLIGICVPFIHAIEEPKLKHQQLGVLRALLRCHFIILLVSPASKRSPWVRLELFIGRLLMRPVVYIDAEVLMDWQNEKQITNSNGPLLQTPN